jgi:hypothetical protein
MARWLYCSLRYWFAFVPWFVVFSYFGTCLWASWVLGRPPRYGELDGEVALELMRLLNLMLFCGVPTVVVYPFFRRRRDWSLDVVAVAGVVFVVATLVFDVGGYMEWYRD